ncbi:MAG: TIGR02147 family protein [Bdellovibrionales bacterium]|nr:TIGR02147 family protein [Bdellovibrionales bacterium]
MRRIDGNSRYSLRAFARDLDLSPSRLSESMNLKSGVSLATVEKISTRLKMTKSDRTLLRDLYLAKGKQNRATRDMALQNIAKARETSKIKRLDTDKFKVIAEWYHTAILQMTDLKQFRPNLDWIANSLALSPDRARRAVERLMDLGLLQNERGRWAQGARADAHRFRHPSDCHSPLSQGHDAKGLSYHRRCAHRSALSPIDDSRDSQRSISRNLWQTSSCFKRSLGSRRGR